MEKGAFVIFLVCIVLAVLAFGAIHTWAYTLVFLGVIAASLLLLKGSVVRVNAHSKPLLLEGEGDEQPPGPRPGRYLRWIQTDLDPLFLFFVALLLLQMLPLPGFLLLLISPESGISGYMSQPAAASLGPQGIKGHWYTIAPYIDPVRMSLIRWTVYGLLFFGLVRCLNSRKRIEAAIVTILVLAVFDALYGIMQTYSGSSHVWWYKNQVSLRDVCGTYLNRNHFAGLMEMTIVLAIAYASGMGGASRRQASPSRDRSFAKRFLEFFSEHPDRLKRLLVVFSGGVMGLGLILSASRGGIIATAGALLLMGLFFFFRKGRRRQGWVFLLLFGVATVFAVHVGLDYTVGRFEFFDRDLESRRIMAEKTVELFKDYLYAGSGVGNFRHAYGKYQDPQGRHLYVDYAHNDFAQFLAEAGVVGAILLVAGLGWYVVRMFRIWRRKIDPFAISLGVAPFGACFAMAIHSFSDYNLHRPANVMVLIAVMAVGYAALHLRQGDRHVRISYRKRMIPLRPWGAILLGCAAGLILWCGAWTIRHFVAEAYCNTDYNITMSREEHPPAELIRMAKIWNPGNAAYPLKLANALSAARDRGMKGGARDVEAWRQSHGPIIAELEQAIRLNPWIPECHVQLGWEYSYLSDRPDYHSLWLPAADLCMDRAAYLAGDWSRNPKLHYNMGNYWMMRAHTFDPNHPQRNVSRTKAVWHYQHGMALEQVTELPQNIRSYIASNFGDSILNSLMR